MSLWQHDTWIRPAGVAPELIKKKERTFLQFCKVWDLFVNEKKDGLFFLKELKNLTVF